MRSVVEDQVRQGHTADPRASQANDKEFELHSEYDAPHWEILSSGLCDLIDLLKLSFWFLCGKLAEGTVRNRGDKESRQEVMVAREGVFEIKVTGF